MNDNPAFTQALQDLGMTRTEAEVYLATLQTSIEEPVSGYKVAQVMGRDPANLSKTLAHLVKVGAVRLVQARPRHYVGVPVSEFTEMLMARMEESREKAITLMASLGTSAISQHPTPLENTAHILAQARRILSQSRGNVVLCCDDYTLDQLEEFLGDLGRNFPDLAFVLADTPKDIPGVKMHAHMGTIPMNTGFADNTAECWLLIAASSGQWLSAFYNREGTPENTRGWVGGNHEISLPVKTVIGALLDAAKIASGVNSEPVPAEEATETPTTPIPERLDEIAMNFEPGAISSVVEEVSQPEEVQNQGNNFEKLTPDAVGGQEKDEDGTQKTEPPVEEGFKFLVHHEDEEEETEKTE